MGHIEIKVTDQYCVTSSLFNNEDFSDIKFILPNKNIVFGHRNILSIHSPVFKAQFKLSMKDSNGHIQIEDEDSDTFTFFIELLYKLRVTCHPKYLIPLFILIDKYQVEKFKEPIFKMMYSDKENVMVYYAATFLQEENQYFLYIISQDFLKLIDNQHAMELTKKMIIPILNLDSISNYQLKAFHFLVKWLEKDYENRKHDFEELIQYIDFSKIDLQTLLDLYQYKSLKESSYFKEILFLSSLTLNEACGKIQIKTDQIKLKTKRVPTKPTYIQNISFGNQTKSVTHHTNGWKTTLGTELRFGVHTWTIKFTNVDIWDGVIIGVAKPDHKLDVHLASMIGWGYYSGGGRIFNSIATDKSSGEPYSQKDLITVYLNLDKCTIGFKKNDKDQGIFFSNVVGPVCIAVCSNFKCTFEIL